MKIPRKAAKVGFLAIGLFTHLSRDVAAMLPDSVRVPPTMPPRDPASDPLFDDKSRLRLAASAEPPVARVWTASVRGTMAISQPLNPTNYLTFTMAAADVPDHPPATPMQVPSPGPVSHDQPPLSPLPQPRSPAPARPQGSPPASHPEASPQSASETSARPAFSASHSEVTKALNHFQLRGIQNHLIRDYVGESKAEVQEMNVNGKEILILRKPDTHAYIGEVSIQPGENGSVIVKKVTGAWLDTKKTVEMPILDRQTEEAERVLKGDESVNSFNRNFGKKEGEEKPGKEISVPMVAYDHSMQLGAVSEATAVFKPDGSGYESGMRTNLGSIAYGGEAGISGKGQNDGFVGVKAGAGVQVFKVEGFVNFFGQPEPDIKGNFTHSVLGTSFEAHGTPGEVSAKLGCSQDEGCGLNASIGAGIGTGIGLNYAPKVKVAEEATVGVPEEGIGSAPNEVIVANDEPVAAVAPPPDAPPPPTIDIQPGTGTTIDTSSNAEDSDAEEKSAYETAVSDHTVSALHDFLEKYPDSPYADAIREEQEEEEHPDAPKPSEEDKIY